MNIYAYRPDQDGKESIGGDGKIILWNRKSLSRAIAHCIHYLGIECRVYTYVNFYDDTTFRQMYPRPSPH